MSSRSGVVGGEEKLGEDRGEAWECWQKAKSILLQMRPGSPTKLGIDPFIRAFVCLNL